MLCAKLRRANLDEAAGTTEEVERLVSRIRARWPDTQIILRADRLSTATFRANQLRLWLSSAAYVLMHALRRVGLKRTRLARACANTIRLQLLKISARPENLTGCEKCGPAVS